MTRINNHFSSFPGLNQQTPLILIDSAVDNYQQLVEGAIDEAKVVILKPHQDGIAQIIHTLQTYPHQRSIHIVSHGAPGCLYLGNTQLSLDTLSHYGEELKPYLNGKNLFLYGCQVAAGDAGAEFIAQLHQLTGAEIAASATLTGNAALGGDWNLDVTTGNVEGTIAFNPSTQAAYAGVLAIITVENTNNNGNGSLRNSIEDANPGDEIRFANSLSGETIELNSEISIDKNLTITGLGANQLTIEVSGNNRIFSINNSNSENTVSISGLTLTGGNVTNDGGGAIDNREDLTLTNVIITGNRARNGGAIINRSGGNITIENSTITGNTADSGLVSGIANRGTIEITNSNIFGNTNNTDLGILGDGSFTSGGDNVIGNGDGVNAFTDGQNGDVVGTAGNPAEPIPVTLPDISIAAGNDANEVGPVNGSFEFTLSEAADNPVTVGFSLNGSALNEDDYLLDLENSTNIEDFDLINGTITIAAGVNSATLGISPLQDEIVETENIELNLLEGDDYNLVTASASIDIIDPPVAVPSISLSASGTEVAEASGAVTYTVSRGGNTAGDLTVDLAFDNNASNFEDGDFTLAVGGNNVAVDNNGFSVTIPDGDNSVEVTLTATEDNGSDNETVQLDLVASGDGSYELSANDSTTVTIIDDDGVTTPTVSISSSSSEIEEGETSGDFTVSRSADNTTGDLDVTIDIDNASTTEDGDFTVTAGGQTIAVSGNAFTVNIPDGQTDATFTVTANADDDADAETLTLDIGTPGDNSYIPSTNNGTTSINITEPVDTGDPTITITATDADATEAGDTGTYTISRGEQNTGALDVNFTVDTDVSNFEAGDFTLRAAGQNFTIADDNTLTVTIPDGRRNINLTLTPAQDDDTDNEIIKLDLADGNGYTVSETNTTGTVTITDDDQTGGGDGGTNPPSGVIERDTTTNTFTLGGTTGEAVNLKFELTGRNTTAVNEIGVFKVDDATGAVGGVSPNNANYVNTVLQNSQTIFSAFSQGTNFFGNAERILEGEFNEGDQLRFYLIPNGTANSVISGDTAESSVRFSTDTQQLGVTGLADSKFTLAWEDGQGANDGNDLIVNFGFTTESAPLGVVQQGTDELLDLSSQAGNNVQLTYSVVSDAGFANVGGVFAMDSITGAVTNGGTQFNPGDAGYAQAAVANSVAEFDEDGLATFRVNGSGLYGVYILPDGNADQALFSVQGANSQGFDQSRLFGDNIIGFEDIAGGGDLDYNDFAVQFDVQQLA